MGGFLSPVVAAWAAVLFADRAAPLWIVAILYLFGSACWWFVDPLRPLVDD